MCKKILLLFPVFLAAAGCIRELPSPESAPEARDFTVTLPQNESSRTLLGAKASGAYKTLWQQGDQISVNGLSSEPLGSGGTATGTFRIKGDILAPYNVLYPASDTEDKVSLPSVQRYVSDSFDPDALPMWGAVDGLGEIRMEHFCSILRFAVNTSESFVLKKIILTALGGEALSGSFRASQGEDGKFDGDLTPVDISTSVSLEFGVQGLPLSTVPTYIHICVPAGVYSRGLSALLVSEDDHSMELKFNTTDGHHEILPSRVIEFPLVEFSASSSKFLIDSVEDLLLYAQHIASYPEAYLINDIDMTGQAWTPIPQMSGHLSATGAITGLGAPFCELLSGSIEGLKIISDLTVTEGTRSALLACSVKGEGASLNNCQAEGRLRYDVASPGDDVEIAGLAALVSEGASVTGCSSAVQLVVTPAVSLSGCGMTVGGVSATCRGAAAFSGNSFTGEIAVNASYAGTADIGGVCAKCFQTPVVRDLSSTGNVECASTEFGESFNAGGVLAVLDGSASGLSSSTQLTVAKSVSAPLLRAGGVLALCQGNGTLENAQYAGMMSVSRAAVPTLYEGGVIAENLSENVGGTLATTDDAALTLTLSSVSGQAALGGIVGNQAVPATLNGLTARGAVNVIFDGVESGFATSDRLDIAGICGASAALEATGCANSMRFMVSGATASSTGSLPSARLALGGVLGTSYCVGDSEVKLSNCSNAGQITFNNTDGLRAWVGGIAARPKAKRLTVSGCENSGAITSNGYTNGYSMGGVLGCIWTGERSEAQVSGCRNSAKLALYDGDKVSSGPAAAGGILGTVAGTTSNPLALEVSSCINTGDIDRKVNAGTTYSTGAAYAGGIVGVLGYNHQSSHPNSAITAVVSECENYGQIIFNAFVDTYTFIETKVDQSFTGGIVGMGDCFNGHGTIRCCENAGNLLSTSGQHGGIIGMLYANMTLCGEKTEEGVRFTVNRGNVGELDAADDNLKNYIASGYLITGGIAGYINDYGENLMEYCYNRGSIAGSSSKTTSAAFLGYCTGGIVGQYKRGMVRYCKNYSTVRNYKCSFNSSTAYSGLLSGCQPTYSSKNGKFSDCGIGGRVWRNNGWVTPDAGTDGVSTTHPYLNYLYASWGSMATRPQDEPYWKDNRIVFWNGASKLDWE